jgi:Helicase conserved C-terminal domain/DEAD/DEAH box helicase
VSRAARESIRIQQRLEHEMARSSSKAVQGPPAAYVAKKTIEKFGHRLHEKAICLTTPTPEPVGLSKLGLQAPLQKFLMRYEPGIAKLGLYKHQVNVVKELSGSQIPNVVMTTTTGSGKSLAFWSWAFEILARDDEATLIATFPTQALLWGQAKRLAAISDEGSQVTYPSVDGICFAGTITIGNITIPWSVWYGVSQDKEMKIHAGSKAFKNARLRLSTLDKIHWSLMRKSEEYFLSRLGGLVIDEAHSWHGLSGANVRAMLDRLCLSMDMLGREHPAFFLASATLADAAGFAEDLTGSPTSSFLQVNDKGEAKAALVDTKDVSALLAQPAKSGELRRYVLLVKPEPEPLAARDIIGKSEHLGPKANALCFVQSKFAGHLLFEDLHRALRDKDVFAYDGDLPAKERRKVEKNLFKDDGRPKLVVGTSALELGVDLPTLDVVVMDELPPRRCDLLQRLGRVGRSSQRPGLAVLCLGYSPGDERLIEEPLAAVAVDKMKPLSLPLHLEVVRLRATFAAFEEWKLRLRTGEAKWKDFNAALKLYFKWVPKFQELKERCEEVLGGIDDLDQRSWYYRGFRVSASQGKRMLRLEGDHRTVAVIDDIAIFRDAHPEAVYLGHHGASYRVKRYVSSFKLGTWTSPGGAVLGKILKNLKYIEVCEERPGIVTRGRWKDSFRLEETRDLAKGHREPSNGALTSGVFTFLREFNGYQEIDVLGKAKPKNVSLAEVTARFKKAVAGGEQFPFLHNFSYRTLGWEWKIARVLGDQKRKTLEPILGPLLQGFFCDAVECSSNDLQVTLDPQKGEIRVVDATPGGNGLSEALLTEGRVGEALSAALKQTRALGQKSEQAFRRYLAEECHVDSNIVAKEVADAIKHLADAWNG